MSDRKWRKPGNVPETARGPHCCSSTGPQRIPARQLRPVPPSTEAVRSRLASRRNQPLPAKGSTTGRAENCPRLIYGAPRRRTDRASEIRLRAVDPELLSELVARRQGPRPHHWIRVRLLNRDNRARSAFRSVDLVQEAHLVFSCPILVITTGLPDLPIGCRRWHGHVSARRRWRRPTPREQASSYRPR